MIQWRGNNEKGRTTMFIDAILKLGISKTSVFDCEL